MSKRMRVLIGYDGSSYSDAAIDDLRRAGLPGEGEALVVSVGDAPIIPPFASHDVIERALIGDRVASIVDQANRQVSAALNRLSELAFSAGMYLQSFLPGWRVRSEVLAGAPAVELIRKAQEWRADLMVVGSQGRSAIGRLVLGSVSLAVATRSPCSVRIGRRASAQPKRKEIRILLGLDGSSGAERAVRRLLMRPWPAGTELGIVAVDDGISPITVADMVATHSRVREDTSITAERMIKLGTAKGLTVSAGIKKGNPQRVLIAEAREWEADCIVIGSRSISNTPQGSLGSSVSSWLAANADCTVEIVR